VVFVGDDGGHLPRLERAGAHCLRVDSPEEAAAAGADVVLLAAPQPRPGEEPELAAQHNAWALVRAAQALANLPAAPRLWCLTTAGDLTQAPLRGVGRIIAGEHPELWGGLIDIATEPSGEQLLHLLRTGRGEDVIAMTTEGDLVARLAIIERQPERSEIRCRPDSTYLVTGGLGALGLFGAIWTR